MIKPYFETENGKLFCGDCLEIMPELKDNVDLCFTVPPYRIHAKSGGGLHNKRDWLKNVHNAGLDIIFKKVKPFPAYIFCSKDLLKDHISWFEFAGLNWEILIYAKRNPIPTKNNKYLSDKEYCFFVRTPGKCYFNNELQFCKYKTVQNISVTKNEYHPAEKVVGYIIDRIETSTKELDTICDPFSGSGTTGIACERLNRKYILIEREEKYCEISAKRITQEISQLKMF